MDLVGISEYPCRSNGSKISFLYLNLESADSISMHAATVMDSQIPGLQAEFAEIHQNLKDVMFYV